MIPAFARWLTCLLCVLACSSVCAQDYGVALSLRAGGARVPFFTRAFPDTLGHGLVLTLSGSYRVRSDSVLSVRVPLMMLEVAQPGGSYLNQFSWGNLDVAWQQQDARWHHESFALHEQRGISLGVPSAAWGPRGSLLHLRALQVANGMDGYRAQELFTSGVIPLVASYGLVLAHPRFSLDAGLRVPVFARFSRARLPADADLRWLSTAPLVHTGARYTPAPWVALGLSADTVFNAFAPVRTTRDVPRVQLALVPTLAFTIRCNWALAADVLLPVAGPLGQHAYSGALTLSLAH